MYTPALTDNTHVCAKLNPAVVQATTSYAPFVLNNWASASNFAPFIFPPNYDSATNIITATQDNEYYNITYQYAVTNYQAGTTRLISCRWLHNTTEIDLTTSNSISYNDIFYYTGSFSVVLQTGDTLQAQFKADLQTVTEYAEQMTYQSFSPTTYANIVTFITGTLSITSATIL